VSQTLNEANKKKRSLGFKSKMNCNGPEPVGNSCSIRSVSLGLAISAATGEPAV